jgi:hypothetical protein
VSEEPSLEDMTSQHGWIKMDYDHARWIPCPPVFNESMTKEVWADGYARIWWEAAGTKFGDRDVRNLTQALIYLHDSVYAQQPCHRVLIHLPDARMAPLPVCFGIWRLVGDREEQLRMLVHADDPVAMQAPILGEVWTESLGTGLKCLYYQRQREGKEVIGALNYAWRSDEYLTDLRIFTATPDLGRLEQAMPDIDELTNVIRFIPRKHKGA